MYLSGTEYKGDLHPYSIQLDRVTYFKILNEQEHSRKDGR